MTKRQPVGQIRFRKMYSKLYVTHLYILYMYLIIPYLNNTKIVAPYNTQNVIYMNGMKMECSLVPIPHGWMSLWQVFDLCYTKHILFTVIASYFTQHTVSYLVLNINVKRQEVIMNVHFIHSSYTRLTVYPEIFKYQTIKKQNCWLLYGFNTHKLNALKRFQLKDKLMVASRFWAMNLR